jgi:hypothetical protein
MMHVLLGYICLSTYMGEVSSAVHPQHTAQVAKAIAAGIPRTGTSPLAEITPKSDQLITELADLAEG